MGGRLWCGLVARVSWVRACRRGGNVSDVRSGEASPAEGVRVGTDSARTVWREVEIVDLRVCRLYV